MLRTTFEPRVGGRFDFQKTEWHATGEIVEIEERGEGTVLHLIHTDLPNEEQQQSHSHGWEHYAGRVKDVAEGRDPGPDTMGE